MMSYIGVTCKIHSFCADSLAASERTSRTPRSTSTGSVSSSTSGWSASALSPGYSHATR